LVCFTPSRQFLSEKVLKKKATPIGKGPISAAASDTATPVIQAALVIACRAMISASARGSARPMLATSFEKQFISMATDFMVVIVECCRGFMLELG
jgi:hypothetical protein